MRTRKRPSTSDAAREAMTLPRRDVLKAAAMLASAPLAAQAASQGRVQTRPPDAFAPRRRDQLFDDGWRFLRGDAPGAENPGFDDSSWRVLDLPHDFSVEDLPPRPADANGEGVLWGTAVLPTRVGPFDTELSAGGRDTGWFVGGTAWYRKHFSAAALPADGQAEIVFDGVYMNSDVWLNGHLLGSHPYGYTPFAFDLAPHLRRTGDNVLAVRIRNDGRNSRWYSGSGIYRHVWLSATGNVRVPLWSLCVTTPDVSKDTASVKVALQIENRGQASANATIRIRLLDPAGTPAGTHEAAPPVAAGSTIDIEHVFKVATPLLWSTGTPRLYRAEVEVLAGGAVTDRVAAPFGIRKVEVDTEHGLRVNGEPVKLKGGCLHHDNGLLGSCAIDRAEERRVELMKAHGFNAIRTSHNPPSSSFLDACDRLGMLVIDEAFDCWERQKNAQDYHLYFADWWQRDLGAMVLRDRNHPSVIIWSIGNEIPERAQPRGVEIAKQLVAHIRTLDPTRPVTAAINGGPGGGEGLDPAFGPLDIGGYNYLAELYETDHTRYPGRIIVGLESFPQQAFQSWLPVDEHPYIIGDFVWTGMDHLGESSIGNAQLNTPARGFGGGGAPPAGGAAGRGAGAAQPAPAAAPASGRKPTSMMSLFSGSSISLQFPWFNCYCGDIDLIGQPKAQWYHRRVIWGLSKLEMAVQRPVPEGRTEQISPWGWSDELRSWTWPVGVGRVLKVRVYTSGDQVRLLLNGKEVGTAAVSEDTALKAEFDVPYAPGELKAIALSGGMPIAEQVLKTAGEPSQLRLTADRASIRRSRNDLSYVTLEVLDRSGQLVPDAAVPVRVSISGAAELAAVGTAHPKDVYSFRQRRLKTFHGRCLAIVRPAGVAGVATVRAEADGFAPATVVVRMT
jgi:beta-galactosidase